MITITFGKPYRKNKDNAKLVNAFCYPFTVTRHATGADYDKETNHEIEVSVSKTLASIWEYSDAELVRVLFEYGRQFISEKIQKEMLRKYDILELHTGVTSKEKQYDPAKIPNPEGTTYQLDITGGGRKIGFDLSASDE